MSLTDNLKASYAPEREGRRWGYPDPIYATGAHRGQDWRKQNADRTASVETEVVAISAGVIDYIGRPSDALGPTIRIRRDVGGYEFHSHTISTRNDGMRVEPGTILGRNARMDERPGLIFGVHDHVVFSDYADGAWNTNRPTRNPAPIIAAALAAANTPAPQPNTESEYPDMFIAVLNKKDWYLVVPQGTGKPIAVVLGADGYGANASAAPIPVLHFTWGASLAGLRRAVDGLPA